jgi:peptidoglycan hydrolase CwlO-like protein
MAENQTLRLVRDIGNDIKALVEKLDNKVDALDKKIDRNHEEVKELIDSLRTARATRQLSATLTEDSGSSWPKQR